VDAQTKEDELSGYGVEPLSPAFTPALLRDRLKKRRTSLKSVLLDQSVIAGLGNIYVDEACFYAGIRPTKRADRVSIAEAAALHRGIQHVIRQAITHRGTTFNNYRDAHGQTGDYVRRLKVYGREREACRRCREGIIKKVKINGRGTHFCPACQQ
jgi:formamidopyrimidine-DNA glycosylase